MPLLLDSYMALWKQMTFKLLLSITRLLLNRTLLSGNYFPGHEFFARQGQECTEVEGLLSQSAFIKGFILCSRSAKAGIEVLHTMGGMECYSSLFALSRHR